MKTIYKTLAAAAILGAGATAAQAQSLQSAYFLDDYTYRFIANPARGNSANFVSMPALANVSVGMNGSLAVTDVLYNVNGRTTTMLNPMVSADEALKNIGNTNRVGYDLNLTVLAGGFKAFGGYNTIAINARSRMGVKLPGELFRMLKLGLTNDEYNIGDVTAFANALAEISIGHSRQITDKLRLGANVKVLLGMGNLDARLKKANMNLTRDYWTITTDAHFTSNIKGFSYKTDVNSTTGHEYVSGGDIDSDKYGVDGWGLGFDLGAVYDVTPSWEISASILDLGYVRYNNCYMASTQGERTFNTNDYTFNVNKDAPNSFSKEWDRVKGAFTALYELDDIGDRGAQYRPLGATLNFGVKYTVPTYRALAFGLLSTTRIQSFYSWSEARLSANYAPCKVFDMGVNVAAGTFGVGFGWIANLHCTGFNFFLGMDRTPFKLAKQGLPLNSNAQVNLGMNFLF